MNIFEELEQDFKSTHKSMQTWASAKFAKSIEDLMEIKKISKKELAEKIGHSPAYITKVLRGDVNYTLETICKLAFALNEEIEEIKITNSTKVSKKSIRFNSKEVKNFDAIVGNIPSTYASYKCSNEKFRIAA